MSVRSWRGRTIALRPERCSSDNECRDDRKRGPRRASTTSGAAHRIPRGRRLAELRRLRLRSVEALAQVAVDTVLAHGRRVSERVILNRSDARAADQSEGVRVGHVSSKVRTS